MTKIRNCQKKFRWHFADLHNKKLFWNQIETIFSPLYSLDLTASDQYSLISIQYSLLELRPSKFEKVGNWVKSGRSIKWSEGSIFAKSAPRTKYTGKWLASMLWMSNLKSFFHNKVLFFWKKNDIFKL